MADVEGLKVSTKDGHIIVSFPIEDAKLSGTAENPGKMFMVGGSKGWQDTTVTTKDGTVIRVNAMAGFYAPR